MSGGVHHTSDVVLDEWPALADEWNELVLVARAPSAFVTHEWISAWWQHFGGGEDDRFRVIHSVALAARNDLAVPE